MKKTNPFKLYFCLIGGFFFALAFIVSVLINIIWSVNSQRYHTYNTVDQFKESEITPFYDMYDAYEYIFNDKQILMSEKQQYIIDLVYTGSYDMKDVGPSQVNARYHIQYNETNYGVKHYEYFKPVHAGTLYITKSLDNPKGIEFCYIHDESSLMYYTVYLTILNIDNFDIQDYANKIEDYVLLTEKHNK